MKNWIQKVIRHYKDNPEGYWFKRKLYGWGWAPVTWQGWLVVLVGAAVGVGGVYVGDMADSPGMMLLGIILMMAIFFGFGYWKGEKPRWRWGLDDETGDES